MRIFQESEIRGKPNLLINDVGINYGQFVNNSLVDTSMEELVDLAEKFGGKYSIQQSNANSNQLPEVNTN